MMAVPRGVLQHQQFEGAMMAGIWTVLQRHKKERMMMAS